MFSHKKGNATLMIMFEIIVVGLVVFMTFGIAEKFATSHTSNKINLANDFTLMVNTLVASPGHAVINYPEDLTPFNIVLKQNSVEVWEAEESTSTIKRVFHVPSGYKLSGFVETQKEVCLEKTLEKEIKLRKC
ncbi:hypothetical protein HOD05_02490 [Candidatus Woesearchaeota archaeon]|jgi:hypothetical protein|nr:hypothetical protein [Candidatus Woesearchaeota archaeon]MBT4150770.1 hypothetical protein [Candidatus Woesearchaeota archaeon]MBT4247080.1 hypothetical protein [Candidatus Woesearchaeota archaeon]MBT4434065.1 hypothetical protein [Candidatus Woesearchaeota archaeon]MBT7331944.1 hypothetical protein [Candidatus Woesearchaeota archaeon]